MYLTAAGRPDKNENEMNPWIFISLVENKVLSPSVFFFFFRLKKKKNKGNKVYSN